MKLKVLYFARLRERLGMAEEVVELPDGMGMVAMLLDVLRARGGAWAEELAAGKNFRVAVNQDMAGMEAPIEDGDEVAIFPPVTGG
ncbi:MAG TPA: molybdopterin converting factor subunit 1 [Sulfuriferula sp.]|nr:molybdopterin converting factor subunit 1 [Sulfuriferula sp.]